MKGKKKPGNQPPPTDIEPDGPYDPASFGPSRAATGSWHGAGTKNRKAVYSLAVLLKRVTMALFLAAVVGVFFKRTELAPVLDTLPAWLFKVAVLGLLFLPLTVCALAWAARPAVPEATKPKLPLNFKAWLSPNTLATVPRLRRSLRFNGLQLVVDCLSLLALLALFVFVNFGGQTGLSGLRWGLYALTLVNLVWTAINGVEILARAKLTDLTVLETVTAVQHISGGKTNVPDAEEPDVSQLRPANVDPERGRTRRFGDDRPIDPHADLGDHENTVRVPEDFMGRAFEGRRQARRDQGTGHEEPDDYQQPPIWRPREEFEHRADTRRPGPPWGVPEPDENRDTERVHRRPDGFHDGRAPVDDFDPRVGRRDERPSDPWQDDPHDGQTQRQFRDRPYNPDDPRNRR